MQTDTSQSDPSGSASQGTEPLACVSCRSRKLKCDRVKPSCGRCIKVSNDCVYPESRRKPTFKRRNVKELEARLAQVEDYLKEVNKAPDDKVDDRSPSLPEQSDVQFTDFNFEAGVPLAGDGSGKSPDVSGGMRPWDVADFFATQGQTETSYSQAGTSFSQGDTSRNTQNDRNTQLMDLGMTEALPPFEVMEELNTIFFQSQYYFIPVVHPGRYLQAFYAGPLRKPAMCLQYAIWALAANGNEKYEQYHEVFYRRARQYADSDEMKGYGEHFITIGHAQAWALIASYEAKCMLFTRAAMSSARCVRLVHMMALDRLDGNPDELPPTLAKPLSWTELEERRRVFWGAFSIDCHASISTGWPSLMNSEDIVTRLPAAEDAFITGRKEESPFLYEVFSGANYSGFAGTVVICQIFKIILHHVHRSKPNDRPEDVMHGNFWIRHRELDNKLSSVFMFLPEKLRLPLNLRDPTATHTNLNLHAAIICLHHAAIEKADKHHLPEAVKLASICRLKTAAEEIVNIIKLTSHSAANFRSPLCALSLYCAITVYVYLAKQNPESGLTHIDLVNLEMIIQAMEAIARVHEITRAFLQQACLDVERNGLAASVRMPSLTKYRDVFGGANSNIPLLARSSVSKHTEVQPVLPGRLPLGNPKGFILPSNLRIEKGTGELPPSIDRIMRELINRECFQAVLGAVTRNVAGPNMVEVSNNKRKRTSPSPAPESVGNFSTTSAAETLVTPTVMGTGIWRSTGNHHHPMTYGHNISLPDRTTPSSASSPANQGPGTGTGTGTETMSGSSHTSSPGMGAPIFGLGNTAEENRVDLRPFQNRVATPIWQSTEDTFYAQIAESVTGAQLLDGTDPWGILNADIDWNAGPNAGPSTG
ncbi:Fc.00g076730.m01.CDS01 [Cosmosporella sp. VM-42]